MLEDIKFITIVAVVFIIGVLFFKIGTWIMTRLSLWYRKQENNNFQGNYKYLVEERAKTTRLSPSKSKVNTTVNSYQSVNIGKNGVKVVQKSTGNGNIQVGMVSINGNCNTVAIGDSVINTCKASDSITVGETKIVTGGSTYSRKPSKSKKNTESKIKADIEL